MKVLVRWATGERLTDCLPKLRTIDSIQNQLSAQLKLIEKSPRLFVQTMPISSLRNQLPVQF